MEHKETSEGTLLPEDVRPISVSARHGTDVKADHLDKDLVEYALKPVRPVSLCTDKTSYRFALLKVELEKENSEKKHTGALNFWTNIAARHCQFLRIETEFESLFCTDIPTSFECFNRFNDVVLTDTWIQSNNVERTFVSIAFLCSG